MSFVFFSTNLFGGTKTLWSVDRISFRVYKTAISSGFLFAKALAALLTIRETVGLQVYKVFAKLNRIQYVV